MNKNKNLSFKEIESKINRYQKNLAEGIVQITEMPADITQYILFCLLQDCLYTRATGPFISKHFELVKYDEEYREKFEKSIEEVHGLLDHELVPLNRKRLTDALEELITSGGPKKFNKVLRQIEQSMEDGVY